MLARKVSQVPCTKLQPEKFDSSSNMKKNPIRALKTFTFAKHFIKILTGKYVLLLLIENYIEVL